MTLLCAAFFTCGFVAFPVLRWATSVRGPVNVVRGVLLPNPSDERWEPLREGMYGDGRRVVYGWKLGAVEMVTPSNGKALWVAGEPLRGRAAGRYIAAVVSAQQERKALEAAL